jgi:hypothetical protein
MRGSCSRKRSSRASRGPESRAELEPLSRWFGVRVFLYAAVVVPVLLRLRLEKLRAWLEPGPAPRPGRELPPAAAEALVRRVDAILREGRPLVRTGCLTRGITLYHFLRRAGADVALCFGMGEIDGTFAGHCWIVLAGEPLAEPRDPRPLFVETFHISPSHRVDRVGNMAGMAAAR